MSNYAQLTLFTPKDALISGNPLKLLRGAEFDAEFSAISLAIASKLDTTAASTLGANPTGTVGLAAVNGVAATFIRSDGAPALSQAIVPTWTGVHTYSAKPVFNAGITVNAAARNVADLAQTALLFGNVTDNPTYTFTGSGVFATGGVIRSAAGAVGAPAHAFTSATDMGMYQSGGASLGLATNGVLRLEVDSTGIHASVPFKATAGASGSPSMTFEGDPDTGFYSAAGNAFEAVAGAARVVQFNSTALIPLLVTATNVDGAVNTPTYTFNNDLTTGFYRTSGGDVSYSAANARVFRMFAAASGAAQVADFGGTLQTVGFRHVPQNLQSVNYTLVLADSGKHIHHASGAGAGDTYTIPANGSVAYDVGTVLTFVNLDTNAVTIAITADTMRLAGPGTTGSRTLAQFGIATAMKVAATEWIISGTNLT